MKFRFNILLFFAKDFLLYKDFFLAKKVHDTHNVRIDKLKINLNTVLRADSHEQLISNAGWARLDFAEREKCKAVLLRLSLARNLEI